MASNQWEATEGKQRAVLVELNGKVVSADDGHLIPFQVMVVESGVAIIGQSYLQDDDLKQRQIRIPILDLPEGVEVVKVVAAAWPSAAGSSDIADKFGWAVDRTE